jgi:hypothetical protein
LLWMEKGWIDYLMPQLYWEHGHKAAAFDVLLPWWEKHSYNRHIYYGLGVYRMVDATNTVWKGPDEILKQISAIRNNTKHPGFSFYSASSFGKIPRALRDSLQTRYNVTPALVPPMKWLDSIPPMAPSLRVVPSAQGSLLQWDHPNPTGEMVRFVVYRFVDGEPININQPEKIMAIVSEQEFIDATANDYQKCTYVVTALDRLWNESRPSNTVITSLE